MTRDWKRKLKEARARRRALVKLLGGECAECGSTVALTFHHPNGRTWEPRTINQLSRMRLYEQDHAAGNLALLCGPCNGHDGAWNRERYAAIKAAPADPDYESDDRIFEEAG